MVNEKIKGNLDRDIFFVTGEEGKYEQQTLIARGFLLCKSFFAAMAQCLRHTDILMMFFFLIIYDKDFYVKGNFRKRRLRDSCFHLGEREGNRNEQVRASTHRNRLIRTIF